MISSFTAKTPLNRHFCTVLKGHSFLLLPPPRTLTMAEMKTRPCKPKRPTCPACSKPAWLCLCARIKTKQLENSIAVTVLQHSLEKKHPLNSVRIALLGLRNVAVLAVSDVHFGAQFGIRLLESESEMGLVLGSNNGIEIPLTAHKVFEKCDAIGNDSDKKFMSESDINGVKSNQNGFEISGFVENFAKSFEAEDSDKQCDEKKLSNLGDMVCVEVKSFEAQDSDKQIVEQCHDKKPPNLGDVMSFSIGKQGAIGSLFHIWAEQSCPMTPSFGSVLESQAARDALAKGFVVRKLQKREREGSLELEEHMEFEIEVPPGSVLLFPSDEAVSVDGLKAIGFEVKNLIVLDGTWAKAKRMYAENPWLKLVPHLKLEMDKVSLYNGVRMQPKAGCLSTIESTVYALKALGDQNLEGLDDLLDVFESMVSDQRQCKEKRLKNVSPL